jgi:hypothetical protein
MAFISWPWKNRGEAEPTALNRQNLNAAEEALAAQVTSGAIPLPASVVSSSQFFVNIKNHGALTGAGNAAVTTAAIEAAQQEAEELPGNWGIFFPKGTWYYNETLLQRVPWEGLPRRSILARTATFTYAYLEAQFSVINAHGSATFNAATADTVLIHGLDFEIEGTPVAGKGALGLANVAGGEIRDCHLKTNGTNVVNALIDIWACVKNFKLDVQCENLTQAASGGNVWIRNLAATPEGAGQVTENIYISPRSRFVTTTADEAIAVYGVNGIVRDVLIDGATLEGGASAEKHQRLASTFPSAVAERPFAAVENVEWRKCKFIDVEGGIKENGEVLGIGRSTGTAYLCQNIRHVDCTFRVKASATKVVATRSIPSKYEGGSSGIAAVRPYVNAEGSTEPLSCAIEEFPLVEGGTSVGNILQACRRCQTVTGGSWEATEKVFYDCNSVGGDYQVQIPNTTGIVFYREANTGTWSGIASYGKGEIVGGKQLLVVHPTVEAANTISVANATMTATAEAGNVIETPTTGSIPTICLRSNVVAGPKELVRKGKFAQVQGNVWFGVAESGTGPTGPEGFFPAKLKLPSEVLTYLGPGATTSEKRKALAESELRAIMNASLILTSGTAIFAAIPTPAKTVCKGLGLWVVEKEATPANRTHFWVALLNAAGEVVAVSEDFTSSTNTPIFATAFVGLTFSATYETPAEELLRGVVCTTMSSTNPFSVVVREGNAVENAVPDLCGTAGAGLSTPAALKSTPTLTGATKYPYMVVV